MSKLRTALMLGVVVVAVLGAVASIVVAEREVPGVWRALIAIQAGVVVALAVTVHVMLAPTMGKLADLVEALHALARGERQTRVVADDFGGLKDVARAINDIGASLCENDDPNLGPIKKAVRTTPLRRPSSDSPRPSSGNSGGVRRATLEDIADAPGVGEVRPSKKPTQSLQTTQTTQTTTTSTSTSTQQQPQKVPAPQPSANASTMALLPTPVATKEPVEQKAQPTPTPPSEPAEPSESTEIPRAVVLDADGVSEARPSRKATKKAKKAAAAAARAEGSTSIPTSVPTSVSSLPSAAPPVSPPVVDEPTPAAVDATLEPISVVELAAPAAGEIVVEKNADPEPEASSDDADVSTDTVIEPAPTLELPTRDELQKLFDEFLREKKAARQIEGLDVDFDAFAETIRSESERLVAEHHCRGVRFEVAVAEGEVSLRPRLIR